MCDRSWRLADDVWTNIVLAFVIWSQPGLAPGAGGPPQGEEDDWHLPFFYIQGHPLIPSSSSQIISVGKLHGSPGPDLPSGSAGCRQLCTVWVGSWVEIMINFCFSVKYEVPKELAFLIPGQGWHRATKVCRKWSFENGWIRTECAYNHTDSNKSVHNDVIKDKMKITEKKLLEMSTKIKIILEQELINT